MDRHVCNFRHVNKSQLLDIDEHEMKRIEEKRGCVCFKKKTEKRYFDLLYERAKEREIKRLLKTERKNYCNS